MVQRPTEDEEETRGPSRLAYECKKANRRHTYIFESQVSPAPDLTRDSLVGFRWLGVSFRWYCGVGGLVVGH